MDAREYLRRWDAAIERYHRRRPEDAEWRQRVNAALAQFLARVRKLEDRDMADLQKYKGPFQVVVTIDGDANEKIVGAGLDWQGARELSDYYAGREHVRSVLIRDEPSQQTVEITYDRESDRVDDSVEQSESRLATESQHTGRVPPRDNEQSPGDPNRVG